MMTVREVLVARRYRSMAIRPVHRIKHVIDASGALTVNTVSVIDLIHTVDAPTLGSITQCETGSKVNGIYLKVEANHTGTSGLSNIYMIVYKNVANAMTSTRPAPNAVGAADTKRYVIHQEMVMLSSGITDNGNPRILFNGVIAIPRGYRRNGPDDKLQVVLLTPSVQADFCVQAHYKEFR